MHTLSRICPRLLLVAGTFFISTVSAQIFTDSLGIPRDTSFTLSSATIKAQKKYPFIQPVFPEDAQDLRMEHDRVYAEYGKRKMHLDVFRPLKNSGSRIPAVVFIHGGGWAAGDKSLDWPLAQHVAREGFVTVAVEYRLSPEAKYPAAVHDIKSALRWMRAHVAEFGIDTMRIAVCGSSAGGQLAALVGVTNGVAQFEGEGPNRDRSSAVHTIINIDGYSDFTLSEKTTSDTIPSRPSSEARWLGGTYQTYPDTWREASPLTYVRPQTPPVLFINSSLVRYRAGRDEMIAELTKFGVVSQAVTFPDTPHPFWLFRPWFDETKRAIVEFLRVQMK
jgi:acetyl esterase/lipase